MRLRFVAIGALAAFGAWVVSELPPALADEEVRFNSASTPPTPFRQKRAQAQGVEAKPTPGIPLTGILTKPDGKGPYPTVLLLHGCQGIRPFQTTWADRLADWGYVALQIDSHGPRGIPAGACSHPQHFRMVGEQILDAYGAVEFLRTLPFADTDRMAVLGWGYGGYAALALVQQNGMQQVFAHDFDAIVGLYPACARHFNDEPEVPVLVVNGANDDQSLPTHCRAMEAAASAAGRQFALTLLEGARHGFDDPEIQQPTLFPTELNLNRQPPVGVTRGYNAVAVQQATKHVRTFLAEHLTP